MVRYFQLMGPEGIRLATLKLQLTQRVPVYEPSGAEHGATGYVLRKWEPDLLTKQSKPDDFLFFLIYGGNRRKVIGLMTIV